MKITIEQQRLSSAEAEIRIDVEVDGQHRPFEVRGHLSGPRSTHSETIQLAYPLKQVVMGDGKYRGRVLIPEPNLWKPETPFTYEGVIELWHDGKKIESKPIVVCFKAS